jgi:ABC-type branched-subunit amino acid transport system substrate-binding protein/predicted negative regulator of RcsB-dependent stress response
MSVRTMPARCVPIPARASRLILTCIFLMELAAAGSVLGQTATPPKPPSATVPTQKERVPAVLDQAKGLIEHSQHDNAITLLTEFTTRNPRSPHLDKAYLLMAAALTGKQAYSEAVSYLEQLLSEFPNSELTGRARIMLARARVEMGEADAALPVLAEARSLTPDVTTRREALRMIGEIYSAKADPLKAVEAWLDELDATPADQRQEVRDRLETLVLEKMDRKMLQGLRDAYPARYPGDLALIRLIELQSSRGEDHLAERNIQLFLSRFPGHAYTQTASELLRSLRAKLKNSQYVMAAVLPLTGRLAPFGTEVLNGIRLALDKAKDTGLLSVGLIVKDSEADKGVLRGELLEIIAEYSPIAVIGPLMSRDLPLASSIAEQTETPFITPSATSADVRKYSSFLFSTALTPPPQAHRIVDYAMTRLAYDRFCVLHPDTAYGRELAKQFTQEVRQRGGEIIAMESYKPTDTDFGPQIRRIKELDLQHYGTTTTTKTSKGTPKTDYKPGFDAIFLPGDYGQVALIAPQLVFYDIKVTLLGTNGWNSPELIRLSDRWMEGGLFVDAFFVDSPDPGIQEFVDRYRRRYQSNPSVFAAQAYDAARLVLDGVRRGATNGRTLRDQLKVAETTVGNTALFGPTGVLNRRLFVIQVKQNRFVQID